MISGREPRNDRMSTLHVEFAVAPFPIPPILHESRFHRIVQNVPDNPLELSSISDNVVIALGEAITS